MITKNGEDINMLCSLYYAIITVLYLIDLGSTLYQKLYNFYVIIFAGETQRCGSIL